MKNSTFKLYSGTANALIAIVSLAYLLLVYVKSITGDDYLLIAFASSSAFVFGYFFSDLYKVAPGQRPGFRPFAATALISLPSALLAGIIYEGFFPSFAAMTEAPSTIDGTTIIIGSAIGAGGFLLALPVSSTLGALFGWHLTRCQRKSETTSDRTR